MLSQLKNSIINSYTRIMHCCGVKKRKVVFISFGGKSYSDNPKSVSEMLHSMMPEAQIYWLFLDPDSKKNSIPPYVHCVCGRKRLPFYRHLATASAVVSNFSFPRLDKSKDQLFIQTWHGDKAFKKVLHDANLNSLTYSVAEDQEGFCDLAVAGSEYGKRQYESAFRYRGKILMEGTPRNDRLVQNDPELRCELKHVVGVAPETKILLYAPTLRDSVLERNQRQKIQDFSISATLDALEQKDGNKWCCLLRTHPAVCGLDGVKKDDRIMDVSGYEDMADLLLISDMLITDYSSCAGDFALLRRPLVLFQSDKKEYIEKDRSLYFDIEDSPYFVAESQQQLEEIIKDMTPQKAAENCNDILRFYGDVETGHASRSVAQVIIDWLKREEK